MCHLIGHPLALPLDVELLRPGEGEETAAKRLLERVFASYGRFFDVVVGDALYLDAPFLNFCLDHHKHAIVTIRGDQRLLLYVATNSMGYNTPPQHSNPQDGKRSVFRLVHVAITSQPRHKPNADTARNPSFRCCRSGG